MKTEKIFQAMLRTYGTLTDRSANTQAFLSQLRTFEIDNLIWV